MTTMTRVTATNIDSHFAPAAAGQAPGVIAAPANGDLVPISSGSGTLLIFQTTGTAATVTIVEVVAPPFGAGGNITVTLAATDFQTVFITNDGVNRFDQGGANIGLAMLNYTTPTGLTVRAVTIP
jgi:hypothetical protein